MNTQLANVVISLMRQERNECDSDCKKSFDGNLKFCEFLLLHAAKEGAEDIVKVLINHGVNVNFKDSENKTALHHAILHKHNKIVKLLLQNDADVNALYRDNCGREFSSLMAAAEVENIEIVELLLDYGANINLQCRRYGGTETVLCQAAKSGHIGITKLLLNRGASELDEALHLAVEHRHEEVFKLLLGKGANPLCVIEDGESLLHKATRAGNMKILKKVLCFGIDMKAKNIDGETALHMALDSYNEEIVQLLLDHGANAHEKTGNGETCLHLAAMHCDEAKNVEFFLQYGFNINELDNEGKTPLFYAVVFERTEVVEFLLKNGADVNVEQRDGSCIMDTARECDNDRLDIVQILIKHIVQMKFKKLNVCEKVSNSIKKSGLSNGFKVECEKEIESMKEQTIDDSTITIYDIFQAKDIVQFMGFARNENVKNFLESDDFESDFPIYHTQIVERFNHGVERNELMERLKLFFDFLSLRREKRLPKLPLSCLCQIFNHLSDKDASALSSITLL